MSSETAFATVFFRDNCRPDVVSKVISSANIGQFGMNIYVTSGYSSSNSSRDMRLRSRRRRHFRAFSHIDNFRPEEDGDLRSGKFVDPNGVNVLEMFDDSRPNRSRDIRLTRLVTNDDNDDDAGVGQSSRKGSLRNPKYYSFYHGQTSAPN